MELTDEQRKLVEKVRGRFESAQKTHKATLAEPGKRLFGLYRNYAAMKSDWRSASSARDKDHVLLDNQRPWGAGLHIPYGFSTVETLVPRMLSHRPSMLVLPRDRAATENVANMKAVMDAQQSQMNYEVELQKTCKNGLIINLGVQKIGWRKRYKDQKHLTEASLPTEDVKYVEAKKRVCVFDDPVAMDVHPLDFFWDPMADSIESCEYVLHRTWRTTAYVRAQFQSQNWTGLDAPDVQDRGGAQKWDESRQGFKDMEGPNPRKDIHEVWEYHDGSEVITVLNRELPVSKRENPYWHGELPFSIYRPTIVPGQFVGIGAIEPLEHLILEINTLRSQRRDNATLVLQRTFAYQDGMIDPDDLDFAPGMAVPTTGDPRETLFQIPVSDIPNSGYQEEALLKEDIERTSGISDPVSGTSSGGDTTATEVQIVHASANARIQQQVRNLEAETIKRGSTQMMLLNQQHIVEPRDVRYEPTPEPGRKAHKWAFRKLGPAELKGDFDIEPEGGATTQENVPQMRQDGQMILQSFMGNPQIDQRQLIVYALEKFGIKSPEHWMKQPDPSMESFLTVLRETGGHMAEAQGQQSQDGQPAPNPFTPQVLGDLMHQAMQLDEEKAQQSPNEQAPPQ